MESQSVYKAGIIGFGALGQQIFQFLLQAGAYKEEEFLFFDDYAQAGGNKQSVTFSAYRHMALKNLTFFVGLGYKHLPLRLQIIDELLMAGMRVGSLVHHSAFVNPTATIGPGVLIYPMCNVDLGVTIGKGVILNNSVTLSHDCRVGDACFLAPSTTFSGHVTTGSCCFLGTGSVVANGVRIGERTTVAIGSVITRNIPDGSFVAGNPGKIMKRNFKLH